MHTSRSSMFTSTCVVEPFGETPAFIICSLKKRNLRAISPHLFIFTRTNIYPPDISKSIISVLIFFSKKQKFIETRRRKYNEFGRQQILLNERKKHNDREKEKENINGESCLIPQHIC